MAYNIDIEMILEDLHKGYGMLSQGAKNFILIVSMQQSGITAGQFKILNEMHDEILKAHDATEC